VERLVVVHDELDLPYGSLRLKRGGGDNGHNGLRSITRSLGSREYLRVRFGIGRPPGRMDAADYVLRDSPRPSARTSTSISTAPPMRSRPGPRRPGVGPEPIQRLAVSTGEACWPFSQALTPPFSRRSRRCAPRVPRLEPRVHAELGQDVLDV
jgi:hypothetical protein